MSRISNQTKQLQNSIQSKLADKNLDKQEYAQLKAEIANSSLSPETKEGVLAFLKEARSDSKGFFFGIFGRGISKRELKSLKNMAASSPQNAVLKGLVKHLDAQLKALSPKREHQNHVQQHAAADFEPSGGLFNFAASNNNPSIVPYKPGSNHDFNQLYVTQNSTGLPSAGGDCGPACAAMVAKRFGFLEGKSNRDAVQAARNASGQTRARPSGAWALTENQLIKSVTGMTGGRVKLASHTKYKQGQAAQLTETLRNQLKQGALPVLETGSPYRSTEKGGRHFMVVLDVLPDGSLMLADPGGNGYSKWSQADLAREMIQADGRGGSHILSFNRY